MAAYYLVDVREIKDPVKMADYRARINPVVERFGGRYVVIGGPVQVLEGSYQPRVSGNDPVPFYRRCTALVQLR